MTAFGLYPTFTDREGYKKWRNEWKLVYKRLSSDILRSKNRVKELNRAFDVWNTLFAEKYGGPAFVCAGDNFKGMPEEYVALYKGQMELLQQRAVARKMMTLLDEAKERRSRIMEMHKQLADQEATFPVDLGECRNIDFHFNKGHAEFPFLPLWTIRAKGRSYYVNEVTFDAPCTTKERASGSTKGVLRFSRGNVMIDKGGKAMISAKVLVDD